MASSLDDVYSQIRWVGDALIPSDPDHGMPSASQVGVPLQLLPRALKARPDLMAPFVAALEQLPVDAPADPLGAVRALGDATFDMVSHLMAGAYFLDDGVNRTLRYPGQQTMLDTPDYDEVMEVAQRVMDRGQVYLDVPD